LITEQEILVSNLKKSARRPVGKPPLCKMQKILFQNEDMRPSHLTAQYLGKETRHAKLEKTFAGLTQSKDEQPQCSGFSLWCRTVGNGYSPLDSSSICPLQQGQLGSKTYSATPTTCGYTAFPPFLWTGMLSLPSLEIHVYAVAMLA